MTRRASPATSAIATFDRWLPLLVFGSGMAGLVYESLWMRLFSLIFGSTTHAVAVILATFMGGLTLGSFLTTRLAFRRPLRAYAIAEAGIGLLALVSFPLLRALPALYGGFVRAHPLAPAAEVALRSACAVLVILPATLLMGATIPILTEFLARARHDLHGSLGRLYRLNTLGGAFGVFAATYAFMPVLGVTRSLGIAVAVNLAIGFAAWRASAAVEREPAPAASLEPPAATEARAPGVAPRGAKAGPRSADVAPAEPGAPAWIFPTLAFASGLVSFALEVLWTRAFALVIGSSIYAFNLMLLSFLLGIVFGTALYERTRRRIRRPLRWSGTLLLALGALALVSLAAIGQLPGLYLGLMHRIPASFLAHQFAGFLLCFVTMIPITTIFGFSFPMLLHLSRSRAPQAATGALYAANTVGAIAGSMLTGFVLIPLLEPFGLQASYVWVATIPLVLGAGVLACGMPRRRALLGGVAALLAVAGVALSFTYRPWNPLALTSGVYYYGFRWAHEMPDRTLAQLLGDGRRVAFYDEGREAVVSVLELGTKRSLVVNGKADAGNGLDVVTQRLLAHIPLLLHHDPKSLFVVGWGSGCTVGSAALHPLERIDCVEIEPATYAARQHFADIHHDVDRDPRLHYAVEDARNRLLTTARRYDVIISEPSNPWLAGSSHMFTRESFAACRDRLAPGGLMAQWFHFYNLTAHDVKIGLRTFSEVFPYVTVWALHPYGPGIPATQLNGDLLLVGSMSPQALDAGRVARALGDERLGADLRSVGVLDPLALASDFVLDRAGAVTYATGAPLHTDDHPVLEFSAPKGLYPEGAGGVKPTIGQLFKELDATSTDLLPPLVNARGLDVAASRGDSARALREIGARIRAKGAIARAARIYAAAVALDPASTDATLALGELEYLRGDVRGGERWMFEARRLDPGNPEILQKLIVVLMDEKDPRAREVLEDYMRIRPDDAQGQYLLAVIATRELHWDDARRLVEHALVLDPQHADAKKLVTQLDQRERGGARPQSPPVLPAP